MADRYLLEDGSGVYLLEDGTSAYLLEAPTLYWVVYPSADSAPSAAQIKAGQKQSGAAANAAGNETSPTDTTNPFTFAQDATGLTAGTSYKTSYVWSDGTNDSTVVTSDAWVTLSAGTTTAILPAGCGYMGSGRTRAIMPAGLGYMG
jgi:hypothetical protein